MKILQDRNGRKIISGEVVIKKHSIREHYEKECDFYLDPNMEPLRPGLYGYHDDKLYLIMQKAIPILEIRNNKRYRNELWQFLEMIHNEYKLNHMDCHLKNVVILNGKPKMIDWQNYTYDITEYSQDLYGWRKSKVEPTNDYMIKFTDGIWWGGPHDISPGVYWGEMKGVVE